ncbi:MAG: hypothetical protein CM1200mP15_17770 [Dehalococcoidia bacterium]|nr:MAG: hypothetical protein CM1200mP15_17770 [Dehalococcoidia bacterium]
MLSVEIQQILDHLDGTWFTNLKTQGTSTKIPDRWQYHGLRSKYFCRHNNQAVITRAERPDIPMACFKGDTKMCKMTGGKPTEYVQIEARNLISL